MFFAPPNKNWRSLGDYKEVCEVLYCFEVLYLVILMIKIEEYCFYWCVFLEGPSKNDQDLAKLFLQWSMEDLGG